MKERSCDVLVVGGGPAGAEAARAAAAAGAAVLLVDRRVRPGEPVQCGEWVPRLICSRVPVPPAAVAAAVTTMRTRLWAGRPGGAGSWEVQDLAAPGLMLDRAAFDRSLLERAAQAGAEVWSGAAAVGFEGHGEGGVTALVRRGKEAVLVRAAVLVGADGARSAVGRAAGLVNGEAVLALQRELPCTGGGATVEVYLHPDFAGGYGWFFPKGRTANVGVGVNPALAGRERLPALLARLEAMLRAEGKVTGQAVRITGGWIPVGGMLPRVRAGRILLAGDAAGLAHPVTGAGVLPAVVSGALAGAAAAEAVRRGERALAGYEEALRREFGAHLTWAAARRREWERFWRAAGFADLARRCWVGFPGYWAGRGAPERRMAHG